MSDTTNTDNLLCSHKRIYRPKPNMPLVCMDCGRFVRIQEDTGKAVLYAPSVTPDE